MVYQNTITQPPNPNEENQENQTRNNVGKLEIINIINNERRRDSTIWFPQVKTKIKGLEEKIRALQGYNSYGDIDFGTFSWFPQIEIPHKFKVPDFNKFDGTGNPKLHLNMYSYKMAEHVSNEPLLI